MSESGIVISVGSLGKNFAATNQRAYWNHPRLYVARTPLLASWRRFVRQAEQCALRRVVMRTFVSLDLLCNLQGLPVEAVIPCGDQAMIYLGTNNHRQISALSLPITTAAPIADTVTAELPPLFELDTQVSSTDVESLFELWKQFGWTADGVALFVDTNRNPIQVIRYSGKVVAVIIAESLRFASQLLVEVTEMAVLPEFQGLGLSKVLIQQISDQCWNFFGRDSLVYGEFNMTSYAHRSAVSAGMFAGIDISHNISGILADHVSIQTGPPNEQLEPWSTEYLHSFQVMYWPIPAILER